MGILDELQVVESALGFTFKALGVDPVDAQKQTIIYRLQHQVLMDIEAIKNGEGTTQKRQSWLIPPSYEGGPLFLMLRVGNSVVPLGDRGNRIRIPDLNRAPAVIAQVIEAVKAGELDSAIDKMLKNARPRGRAASKLAAVEVDASPQTPRKSRG